MQNLITYFQSFGINLSSNLLDDLKAFKLINLSKGEYFHKENAICDKIAFLSKGKIRHYYSIEGSQFTRWVSLENSFVTSFSSFINQKPSLDNLECIEDCEIYVTSKESFESLRANFQEINNLWITAIEKEMAGYEYRIYQMITQNAEQRYLDLQVTNPQFIQEIPQKYLASMLGVDVRHLSRIRKKIASSDFL